MIKKTLPSLFKKSLKLKISLFYLDSFTLFKNKYTQISQNLPSLLFKIKPLTICIICFDIILFSLLFYRLGNDLLLIVSYHTDIINNLFGIDNIMCGVKESSTSSTTTQIIHSNEGWAQGIKSIFIYGTGALRLHLLRGGTPAQRGFVIASTLIGDAASTAVKNAVNDPTYVEQHIKSWRRIFNSNIGDSSVGFDVSEDPETLKKVTEVNSKFLPENFNTDEILNYFLNFIKQIIEPVSVNYSNELLANQIYGISIILFILSLVIIILFISFIINIVIFIYSGKLLDYFTNKYIRWYIALNKKLIGIEICFLGGSLLYFMYMVSYGIHFIATHPIIIS